MGKIRDDGSKPCDACQAYTKIRLPCGNWVCLGEILGFPTHSKFETLSFKKAA